MGEKLIVYQLSNSINDGKLVAEAFQRILGKDYIDITYTPIKYTLKPVIDLLPGYSPGLPRITWEIDKVEEWEISYCLKVKKEDLPKEILDALEYFETVINSSKSRYVSLSLSDVSNPYSNAFSRDNNSYINYWSYVRSYREGLVDIISYNSNDVEMNFDITLWHEAIGHGHSKKNGTELGHASVTTPTTHDGPIQNENIARKAWNLNNSDAILQMRPEYDYCNQKSSKVKFTDKQKNIYSKSYETKLYK